MATYRQDDEQTVRAVRGATSAAANEADAIVSATSELLEKLFESNGIEHDDLISMVFTATPDLDQAFPAVAARAAGLSDIPLLCAQEMDVPGAVGRCIRVLIHFRTSRAAGDLTPVYLHDARDLRTDLTH